MLKFKVVETCDDIHGTGVVIEASEAESAKILAGECGKVSLHVDDDKNFNIKMYMKITPPTYSAALATTKPPVTEGAEKAIAVSQAESTNIMMPIVSVVLSVMLLAC